MGKHEVWVISTVVATRGGDWDSMEHGSMELWVLRKGEIDVEGT